MNLKEQTVYIPENPNEMLPNEVYLEQSSSFVASKEQKICISKDELVELLSKSFDTAFIKGYNVGQGDAKSHPLALTISKHIHEDRKQFINNILNK